MYLRMIKWESLFQLIRDRFQCRVLGCCTQVTFGLGDLKTADMPEQPQRLSYSRGLVYVTAVQIDLNFHNKTVNYHLFFNLFSHFTTTVDCKFLIQITMPNMYFYTFRENMSMPLFFSLKNPVISRKHRVCVVSLLRFHILLIFYSF